MPSSSSSTSTKKGISGGGGTITTGKSPLLTTKTKVSIRLICLSIITAYFVEQAFQFSNVLFPWGTPMELETTTFQYASSTNDLLQMKHGKTIRIIEHWPYDDGRRNQTLIKGPETVVINPFDGTMYLMTEESKLIRLSDFQQQQSKDDQDDSNTITAKVTLVRDLGIGRPVGGKFTPDGKTLYIADAVQGLIRIHDVENVHSKVEIVLSSIDEEVVIEDGTTTTTKISTPITFADDITIGPKTGKIYFSDATQITPDRIELVNADSSASSRKERGKGRGYDYKRYTWDVLHASKIDLMRGGPGTGRIIEYDPHTEQTRVLVKGLHFANGISIGDADESYLVFTETYGVNIYKYYLTGERKDTYEIIVPSNQMSGFLDGIDCSFQHQKCYACFPASILPIVKFMYELPDTISILFRALLLLLPKSLTPEPDGYSAILEIDMSTSSPSTNSYPTRLIQDPTGKDISNTNGITFYDNKLYLASIHHDYIGVYSLE